MVKRNEKGLSDKIKLEDSLRTDWGTLRTPCESLVFYSRQAMRNEQSQVRQWNHTSFSFQWWEEVQMIQRLSKREE